MALQLLQIIYWLALSSWFGGVLFVFVAAQIIFRTIDENKPVLPHVLSVNMEGQHGTLLAGTIVGNLLAMVMRIALVCASVLALAIALQWILSQYESSNLVFSMLRSALLLMAAAVTIYDWRIVWPKIWKYRQEFIDHADDPDIANPAKEKFDYYQRESQMLLSILLLLLLGMVIFSGAMMAHQSTILPTITK